MIQFDLNAQQRNVYGKGAAKKLRNNGMTPAVLYGAKSEPVALQLNAKDLKRALVKMQRRNAVFNLDIEDGGSSAKRHVMVKEIQTHPSKDTLIHMDFCEVSLDEPIVLQVPVHFVGTAKGVELGGELVVSLPTVTVKGSVLDIPDCFDVDITDLVIGEKKTCAAIEVPEGVELLHDKDDACVSVHTAKKVVEDEEGEEGTEEEAPSEEAASEE